MESLRRGNGTASLAGSATLPAGSSSRAPYDQTFSVLTVDDIPDTEGELPQTADTPQPQEYGWPGRHGDRLRLKELWTSGRVADRDRAHEHDAHPLSGRWPLSWIPPLHTLGTNRSGQPTHVGKGEPLMGTSWLNRPYYFGWFFGGLFGDSIVGSRVDQGDDVFAGYRLGKDFDHYWGCEARWGISYLQLADQQPDELSTVLNPRDNFIIFWDAHLLYYPWGDSRWRPYTSIGLGLAHFRLHDDQNVYYNEVLFHVPLGLGVKYQCKKWMAVRAELTDNIAFGAAGLSTTHNVSLTGGLEFHYGGPRRSYYPQGQRAF